VVRFDAADVGDSNLSATPCAPASATSQITCNAASISIKVSAAASQARLKTFHAKDYLRVHIENGELKDLLGPVSAPEGGISATYRLLTLAICALLILGVEAVATNGAPLKCIVGIDSRYSNSKFQLALWFWVLISTYLATVVRRLCYAGWDFVGGVNIPQNLLLLSGLSALTYGGAKAITTAKVNAATAAAAVPGAAALPAGSPTVADLKNALAPARSAFSATSYKMILGPLISATSGCVTLVAVGMYLLLIFHFLLTVDFLKSTSLSDVDTKILASFGVGQGAYLTKKAAGNVGTS
jgi:hypothetical protein